MNETTPFTKLITTIEDMRYLLQNYVSRKNNTDLASFSASSLSSIDCPRLEHLGCQFGLSSFERNVLLLCAGWELTFDFASLVADAQGNPNWCHPTWELALALFSDADPELSVPPTPLYTWQLIEIVELKEASLPLVLSPLKIDRAILSYLAGKPYIDKEITHQIRPLSQDKVYPLPACDRQIITDLTEWLQSTQKTNPTPIINLHGNDLHRNRHIAISACEKVGISLYQLSSAIIPNTPEARRELQRRWHKQARLQESILLLEVENLEVPNVTQSPTLKEWLENSDTPVIVSSSEHLPNFNSGFSALEISPLTFSDRQQLWESHLGDRATSLNGSIEAIADTFALSPQSIATICQHIPPNNPATELSQHLWSNCRLHARDRLDRLAQRVETPLTWDDLILPEKTKETLQQILNTARTRFQVYHQWGLTQKRPRGLGICALFSGYSGTGKTTAAEIIAQELNLDCYRVDLSAIVSKYIGETEKNLRQIFDAAEGGGVVLLFDEADALFSKRGEIKEARDRYANQEVSYLLQRIETYPGLTILTTNLKHTIDSAFERRLKFIVDFPKPTYWERKDMWERMYPPQTPTEGLNYDRLPKLNVSGGNLANVALEAAFLAAAEGEAIQMKHLLAAAKADAQRMGRDMHDSEIEKWV